MRCPKCGYISFDKVTSCSSCETDVTELAHTLNGTGFQPMNNFFLGTLLPDFMSNDSGSESSSLQDAADDLNISMDDLNNLGEIGDIPGESVDGLDLGLADFENESTISLQGVVVPEVDLADFDDGDFDNVDTMQISAEQLDEIHAQPEGEIDLDDVPDFDLDGVDLEGDDGDMSLSEDEVDDMPNLDLQMEGDGEEEKTEILNVDDLDLGENEDTATIDLSGIDLSLGDGDSDDVDSDLADLDLGDLEMESDGDLPDLKL